MREAVIIVYLFFGLYAVPLLAQNSSAGQGFIIPKSYSNLKIPAGRKKHPGGAGGVPFSALKPISEGDTPISTAGPGQGPQGPPLLAPTPPGFGPSSSNENETTVFAGPIPPPLPPAGDKRYETRLQPEGGTVNLTIRQEVSDDEIANEEDDDEAIDIDVAMQIQSIREIDEGGQKITIEIDLTVHWKDYDFLPEEDTYFPQKWENVSALLRVFGGDPLPLDEFEKLWKPDIFIERVVKVWKPGLLSSPVTVRAIKRTSSIVYTTRASVKTDCNMNFKYYPADTQDCILDLRSYQNDATKMNLRWNPLPGAYLVDTDSDDNFDLKLSYVAQRKKKVKDINLDDAIFDVLQIKLSMRRRMTYHILQTYIPSAFLVFITWLSFLIPEELIEARIGISMTTLLTLTAMFSAVRESTPVVSYVKAIDIWMVYCIFIVFATLLEFSFFVWLRNYKIGKREKKLQNFISEMPTKNGRSSSESGGRAALQSIDDFTTKAAQTFERTAKLLNQFAFGFFVGNFIIFCAIYWPWLMIASGHYHWHVNNTLNGHPDDTNGGFLDVVDEL